MNKSTPFSALASLKKDFRHRTREHEICRLQFEFRNDEAANEAKQIILEWAENRSGKFPVEAWSYESFEAISVAGRSTMVSVIERDTVSIWGLRNEDPDKEVAGRVWSTEVVIGGLNSGKPKMSVRLLAHSGEEYLPIKISVPGFVFKIFDDVGFAADISPLSLEPTWISTDEELDSFVGLLENPERRLPIIVVSNEGRTSRALIHTSGLAKGTLGLAHVVQLNKHYAWRLSERIGDELSVFDGGIRLYRPGFSSSDNWQNHKLIVGRNLQEGHEKGRADGWFRRLAAEYSFERLKLGADVLSYARIRSESSKIRAQKILQSDSSVEEQLDALKAQNEALERERDEIIELSELYDHERKEALERSVDAEQRLQMAAFRVGQLQSLLEAKGVANSEIEIEKPQDITQISDWCSKSFPGKLTMLPRASKGLKKAEYQNVTIITDALEWLATECREARMSGGAGRMNNLDIVCGLVNARCGSDTYQTTFNGSVQEVDWHIKNGGNTRDPKRCLRIYYFWDEQTNQIVVTDLPAHRKNENS